MTFLNPGCSEPLKVAVHGALGVLAGVCALYNLAAFLQRRDAHLLVNVAVYGALTIYEQQKVSHHMKAAAEWR